MYSWQSTDSNKITLSELIVKLKLNGETITEIEHVRKEEIGGGASFENFQDAITNIETIIEAKKDMTVKKFNLEKNPDKNMDSDIKYFVGYVEEKEKANTINMTIDSMLTPMVGGEKLSEKLTAFVQNIISTDLDEVKIPINTATIDLAQTNHKKNLGNLNESIDGTKSEVEKLCEHNRSTEQKYIENQAKHIKIMAASGGSRKRRRRKRRGLKNKSMKH
jgi:hypothetical protein